MARNVNSTRGKVSNGTPGKWYMYHEDFLNDVESAMVSTHHNPFAGLTKELYTTFWGLTLYDIYVPHAQYEAETQKAKSELSAITLNSVLSTRLL